MPTWCSPRFVTRKSNASTTTIVTSPAPSKQNDPSTNHPLPKVIRIAVLGGAKVGKSTLIQQFLFGRTPSKYVSTVEELYRARHDGGFTLEVLDTSGTYQFPAMRKLAISTADAFILVYALDDYDTFNEVRCLREVIGRHRPGAPVIVVGNKLDLSPSQQLRREITEAVVCVDWECSYVECAAVVGTNVVEVFEELLMRSQVNSAVRRRRRKSLPAMGTLRKSIQLFRDDAKRRLTRLR